LVCIIKNLLVVFPYSAINLHIKPFRQLIEVCLFDTHIDIVLCLVVNVFNFVDIRPPELRLAFGNYVQKVKLCAGTF